MTKQLHDPDQHNFEAELVNPLEAKPCQDKWLGWGISNQ